MSLQSVLAELRREYAPILQTTVAELEQVLATGAGDPRAAWRIAHRIAGTAGSYGFDEIGRAARCLEDALEAPRRDEAAVASALEALRRASADLPT